MEQNKLNEILELHKLWLEDNSQGKYANLRDANLTGANLTGAVLRHANLQDAYLDFSVINLYCKDLGIHLDDRLLIQRLYHLLYNANFSKHTSQRLKDLLLTKELIELANEFHRVEECGGIKND